MGFETDGMRRSAWLADADKRADARWTKMIARRNERMDKRTVYVGSERKFVLYRDVVRPRVQMTDDERRVLSEYETEGVSALRGEPLYSSCHDVQPSRGWTGCAACHGIMPASKTELVKSEGFYSVVWFYHHDCYDRVLKSKSLRTHAESSPTSVASSPATDDEEDGAAEEARRLRESAMHLSLVPERWDLDRPEMDSYD